MFGKKTDGGNPGETQLSELDRSTLENLRKHGDQPNLPRPVDFHIYFRKAEAREQAAKCLADYGIVIHSKSEAKGDDRPFALWLRMCTTTSADVISAALYVMRTIADSHDGALDGWGCHPMESWKEVDDELTKRCPE